MFMEFRINKSKKISLIILISVIYHNEILIYVFIRFSPKFKINEIYQKKSKEVVFKVFKPGSISLTLKIAISFKVNLNSQNFW